MDFNLSEKQKMIKKVAREFCETVLRPKASEIDEEQKFSWENARELGKMGMWGIQVDP